jgi:aryl carrier-like protein
MTRIPFAAIFLLAATFLMPVSVHAVYPVDSVKLKARWAEMEARHPHGLLGEVDSVNAITPERLAQMGLDSARALYLGKTATFKGLTPVGLRAKNEQRKNVCMQGFIQRLPHGKYFLRKPDEDAHSGSVYAYFNFGDEISGWFEHTPHNPKDLKLDHPFQVPFDVCDTVRPIVCHEMDMLSPRRCIFSTERLLIAGRIAAIYVIDGDLQIELRPTGVRY